MVENSTLRLQFFIVFLWELFRYNEEQLLMNKTYYKGILEKWDQNPRVRPRTQDPGVRPWDRTLGWDPRVRP